MEHLGVSGHSALSIRRKTYKRPYRKSTLGCRACKTRKIKCDEARPSCSNCRKRFVDPSCCQYDQAPHSKQPISTDTESSTSSSPVSSPCLSRVVTSNPIGTSHSSMMELRLMYHYTRITCGRKPMQPVSLSTVLDSMWAVEIPQIAFSNEIVLNAVLGIAAFHILSLNPSDRSMAHVSRMYWNKALMRQRDALSSVDRENAEPLFISAILLAHQNWLFNYSDETQSTRGVDLSTYHLCKGATFLAQKALKYAPKYNALSELVLKVNDGESEYDVAFMNKVREDTDSLKLYLDRKEVAADNRQAYDTAIADFIDTCSLFAGKRAEISSLENQIVTVLHRMHPNYITLLDENDPIAMSIMARNTALLGIFEDNSAWWVHGAGCNAVPKRAVRAIANQMPKDFMWMMDFPYELLTKKIKVF